VVIACKVSIAANPDPNAAFTHVENIQWVTENSMMVCQRHEIPLIDPVEGLQLSPAAEPMPSLNPDFSDWSQCQRAGMDLEMKWDNEHRNTPWRVWRIGWLSPASGPGRVSQSFLQGMQERGYAEGKNLAIEYRWSAGKSEPLEQFAAELVGMGVDVIVTVGTPATQAAKLATSTIPIVFAAAGAPIEKGLVSSLGRPGGNVTGLALITDDIKSLEILKEIVPGISRAAFIYIRPAVSCGALLCAGSIGYVFGRGIKTNC